MKHFIHLALTGLLAVFGFVMHSAIMSDAVGKSVTTYRLYVMKLLQPSVPDSVWQPLWPPVGDACLTMTNLSQEPTRACLNRRVAIQTAILTQAGCAAWQNRSQACTLIARIVQGLAYNVTGPGGTFQAGKNLALGANPLNKDHNPIDYVSRALASAPLLMHNAYRASVSENNYSVITGAVYILIPLFAFLNMLGQVLHYWDKDPSLLSWVQVRPSTLVTALTLVVVFSVYMAIYTEMQPITAVLLVPPFVFLLWFDTMLPALEHRPFIHPAVFAVLFSSVTLLALLDCGVQNYRFLMIELLKTAGVGQLFMGLLWYFMGYWEKLDKDKSLATLYRTKGAYLSVVLTATVLGFTPLLAWMAPYDLSFELPFLSIAPVIFVALTATGIFCTHFLGASWRDEGVACFFNVLLFVFVVVFVLIHFTDYATVAAADSSTSRWIQSTIQYSLGQDAVMGLGLQAI